jgi:hypothetical protein
MDAYWSWKYQHTSKDRLPHGESVRDALRRLLARDETVTLVIVHELALRYTTAAATSGAPPVPARPSRTRSRTCSTSAPRGAPGGPAYFA